MSVSEHISVFMSIVVGLAVADLLVSFSRLLDVGPKVRWYWPTLVLAVYALLVIIADWWGVYSEFLNVRTLSVGQFLPTLSTVITLFLFVTAVLPSQVPKDGLDLRAWYLQHSRRIWVLGSVGLVSDILNNLISLTTVGRLGIVEAVVKFAEYRWDNLLLLVGSVGLIFTRRLRAHEVYIVAATADILIGAMSYQIG
jgi:hypothetical protein